MALRDQLIRVSIGALLAVNIYFATVRPCTSAEGAVYDRFASHTLLDLWKSPLDPRLGLTYGVLARLATRVGGVSELTIRIPALLGGLLFWIGLSDWCRRLRGWWAVLAFLAITANPWTFRAFSAATGAALALGLLVTATRIFGKSPNAASILMGLAIGSDAVVAIPAIAASAVVTLTLRMKVWKWVDELLLPGLLAGLFLLLPALLIREKPIAAATNDSGTRQLIQLLKQQHHGAESVAVGVSPAIKPGLVFYRRRYHLDWIHIADSGRKDAPWFILSESDRVTLAKLGLRVSETAPGVVLAIH